ncbi:bifunctional YncE family protein/alkaline phosphatase family protein [Candidatus Nephthysia bennettiae]|uniref:Bifunctional YncE family protein/alkaline phosphatase family protein n=1 Tax=Candidatus Nephthysia bennettiae TaxID=3127016 RepID=A0A934N871_9BACT|nr:bifunctional YncE family protein/alkaline phosphatase family protein [Candidatus Dormibacteraeota bacterium]MBJ7611050.1 bifunctional YncE family protein/alkaline phosphatase family protein [Candidatus Dormibacteraeota bacterium]
MRRRGGSPWIFIVCALVALLATCADVFAAARATGPAATRSPGGGLLVNGRAITPAGRQAPLGDLPVSSTLSPDGAHLLVVNSGAGVQSAQVVDTKTGGVVQTVPYAAPDSAFVGAAYSPDGAHAYVAGGGSGVVHAFGVAADGLLTRAADIHLGTPKQNPFPTGLSVSPDGSRLAVANNLAGSVDLVDLRSRRVVASVPAGGYPYAALFSRDGARVYVSNWGDATVSVIDVASASVIATIDVGQHPNAMLWLSAERLAVADANSDAVSLVDTRSNHEVARVSMRPYANAPSGSSPQGLEASADGTRLYVADAGSDEISVVQLPAAASDTGARVLGRIPTAWYPTSVTLSKDGSRLYVTNAKGNGAGPNDSGFYPDPTRRGVPAQRSGYADRYCGCTLDRFAGSMIVGTLSTIDVPRPERLAIYSQQVARDNHYGDSSVDDRDRGNPVPLAGRGSPIKHVIYVIKENRTYDQVFGDLKPGNGAPGLTMFGARNTPNLHALASRFGILDNFYADAEVSADGHNWATSADASDYNQKMWPQKYSPGRGRNRGYDFEGGSTINLSPGGYLWDAAWQAGLSVRDYGEFASNAPAGSAHLIPQTDAGSCAGPVARSYTGTAIPAGQVLCFGPTTVNAATTPSLNGREDPNFRTYDLRYRESDRVQEWSREFAQFERDGNLPAFEIMRLPNDHTAGTTPGRLTPQEYVAENDQAVGKVVDAVSHSKDWPTTAIFVTEDDAQNGPDHVDAHRTESLVISPYTQRSKPFVDHTLYDTSAMVRTMELILGMRPLSQFDANATPMWRLFHAGTDLRPYTALPESSATATLNTANSYGAVLSAGWSFDSEDLAPMTELNQVLWHAVKGPGVPYPTEPGGGSDGE